MWYEYMGFALGMVPDDGSSVDMIGGYMAKMRDDIAEFYIFGDTAAVSSVTCIIQPG